MKEESSKEPTIFLAPVSIADGGTNNKSCSDFANQANSSQVTMSEWLNVDEWKDKFTAIKKKVAGSESTAKEMLKKESGKEKDPKKNKSKEKRKKKHSSKEKKKSKKKEAKSKTRKEKHRGKTNNDKKKKDEVTPVLSYEEESAAMDLESLKRKPWFEKEDTEKEKEQDLLKDWDHADDEWCSESEDDQSSVEIKEDYRDFLDIFEKNINKDSQDQGKTKAVKEERNTLPQSPRKNKEQQVIDLCDELSEKVPPKKKAANQSTKSPKEAEYEIQTLKRLEKLIDLRKQREEYRREKEARRQERREQRDKKKEEHAAGRSPRSKSLPRQVMHNTHPLHDSMMPGMVVDLTDICDRRESSRLTGLQNARRATQQQQPNELELNSVQVKRWKSSFQEEIPVIVDVSNRARPKQIYDLTKLSEPPLPPPPSPPRSNHRLEQLRRDREQRYNDFATTFTMLAYNEYRSDDKPHKSTKKKKKHDKKEFEVEEVDDKLMMYYNMMDKVSRNLKMSFCGGGSGSRVSL